MVNVKIAHGASAAVDTACPGLGQGFSIKKALGNTDVAIVYYVELDEDYVVAAVSPLQAPEVPGLPPVLCMHTEDVSKPLFTLYLALRDGESVDLTDDLFNRAQALRTDMMYEDPDTWNGCAKP